jgi:hypothetical protein
MPEQQKVHFIPQGYPLYIAYAIDPGRGDNPNTEEGRWSLVDHAAQTNQMIEKAIGVSLVIGWQIVAGELEPCPITTSCVIDTSLDSMHINRISINSETAREELMELMKDLRDRASRRIKAHNIDPKNPNPKKPTVVK